MTSKRHGVCHLCGATGPLTFEHIPPQRVFNDRPAVCHTLYGLEMGSRFSKPPPLKSQPRGMGRHSLCERCNGWTARHYGDAFAAWTYQALHYAEKVGAENRVALTFTIKPLHVLKQIATMALAASDRNDSPLLRSLRRFVLCPFEQYLPAGLDFRAYLNPDRKGRNGLTTLNRMAGPCAILDVVKGTRAVVFAEIAFPPMGYYAGFHEPEARLTDEVAELAPVGFFGNFRYGEEATLSLQLPVKSPLGPVPGYYPKI